MPELPEQKREQRELAEHVALVPGDGVPEVVRVAHARALPIEDVVQVFLLTLSRGLDDPFGADAFALHEVEVRVGERALGHRAERCTVAEQRHDVGLVLEQRTPGLGGEEPFADALGGAPPERLGEAEHAREIVGVLQERLEFHSRAAEVVTRCEAHRRSPCRVC